MMDLSKASIVLEICKPYMFMTMYQVCSSVYMILVQHTLSKGISAPALVVYEQFIATVFVSLLAFLVERKSRPPMTAKILWYTFLLAFLQITLCGFLLNISLEFVEATYESIALNLQTAIIFVLAVIFGQESFRFCSSNGQAKLWGLVASAAGAVMMVLWRGPTILTSVHFPTTSDSVIGIGMLMVGILATCFWSILVRHVIEIYPAGLSLTALMSFFGAIQIFVATACVIPTSSWEMKWEGGIVLITILYGGTMVTGFLYYVKTWCIQKKGAVFTTAFAPLLILFSFLFDTFLLGVSAHLGSIIGAMFIVVGLYLILWAKANDNEKEMQCDSSARLPLIQKP